MHKRDLNCKVLSVMMRHFYKYLEIFFLLESNLFGPELFL